MIKSIKALKEVLSWAKDQNISKLKIGEVEVEFRRGAQLVDFTDLPAFSAEKTDEQKKKEEEELLYYSSGAN